MTDIASLSIQIDSSQALTGAQALDKLTASGKMSEDALDKTRIASLKAADAFRLQGEKIAGASAETQKILNRYDPLGTKLRQLQTDFANLDKAIRENAVGGTSDLALDKTMRGLNDEIAKTKGLMNAAGVATEGGAVSMGHLRLGSVNAQQALMHLGREVMSGDFAQMPMTLARTAMHMNALPLLLNPVVLGIVAIGAAAIAMGVAMVKGAKEEEEMNAAIAKTGDYAGQTRGTMRLLAQEITTFGHVTIGAAKEIVTSLVGSGRIGMESIAAVSQLAEHYANTIGKDIEKALPDLIKLFDDPAKGAAELNKKMHELSPTFLEHLRHLQAIGEKTQAQRELAEALLPILAKQKEELGYINTALNIAAKGWSAFWDAAMGLGRAKTVLEQLKDIQNTLKIGVMQTPTMPGFTPQRVAGLQASEQELRLQVNDEAAEAWYKAMKAGANEAQNAAVALAGQSSEYAKIRKLNEDIVALGKAKTGDAMLDRDIMQAIANKQREIVGTYRAMGAEGRALIEARWDNEIKLYEIINKGMIAEIDGQLKLGRINQEEADKRKLFAALELNAAQTLRTEQELTIKGLTTAEREKLQAKIDQQQLDRQAIITAGALTAELTKQAELNQRALRAYKESEDSNAALTLILRDQGLAQKALTDSITVQLEAEQFQLEIIGKTKEEVTILTALHELKLKFQKAGLETEGEMWEMYKNQVTTSAQILGSAKNINRAQVDMWRSVESAGHQAFLSIFDTSKNVLERIRDMLKTHLIDILYQMTVKKWIFNIVASVSGAGVAQQAIGSTMSGVSAAGGIGNIFSSVSSGSNVMSMLGGGVGYQAGVTGAAIAESTFSGVGLTLGETAGVAMAETFGTTIATAIPYIGWATAAYGVLRSMGIIGPSGTYAQTTGYRLTGTVMPGAGISGLQGYANAANNGEQYADLIRPDQIAEWSAAFDKAFAPVAAEMTLASKALGLRGVSMPGVTVDISTGVTDQATIIAAAIGNVVERMATVLIPNIEDFQGANETLGQTLMRLVGEVTLVRDMFEILGNGLTATVAISDQIATAFGGASNLQTQFQSYYDSFYTQAEKNAIITRQVAEAFATMNLSMPATREGFKALVSGLDLTTASGISMFKSLMDVQAAFATVVPEIIDSMASLSDARENVWRAYDTEADKLRTLADEMGGLGKSLHDLQASLLIGELSPLAPMDQFAEAQRQFRDLTAKARLGDAEALAALSGASQTYLTTGRVAYASGDAYTAIFNEVQAALGKAGDTAERAALNATSQISLLQIQVEELVGIRAGVQTLAEAMAIFAGITGHASGGIASGWSMVGERGPELVNFTSPGRVYTSSDTGAMLGNNKDLIAAVDALREQVAILTEIVQVGDTANVRATNASGDKIAKAALEVDYRQTIRPQKAA